MSPKLLTAGFRHGFFGRGGGVSRDSYASLNCSYSVGDEAVNVEQNLARIADCLGVPAIQLVTATQVHGRDVVLVDAESTRVETGAADALVAAGAKQVAVCVRTADCVPILVGCRSTGAVAAIHAGWKGIVAGVVPAAIRAMRGIGAQPEAMIAAIGPHIGMGAFEVSSEVAHQLHGVAPASSCVDWKMGSRPHVRLAALVRAQLLEAGVPLGAVDELEGCTFSNEAAFFSYRRDGKASGRQLSAILPL